MSSPHNPPAFPNEGAYSHTGDYLPEGGMTLRDWFAGQAIAAMIDRAMSRGLTTINPASPMHPALAAKAAYQYADAMLAERAKARGEA